jgi:hypothetical protein
VPAATPYSTGVGINITAMFISNAATTTRVITGVEAATVTLSENAFAVNIPGTIVYTAAPDLKYLSLRNSDKFVYYYIYLLSLFPKN